jgi:hypothetical protein
LAPPPARIEDEGPYSTQLGQNSIVLAPHGDQFAVTATTGIPSQQRPPQAWHYATTYWLLDNVEDASLLHDSIQLISSGTGATILVDDTTLKRRLAQIDPSVQSSLMRANPHLSMALNTFDALQNYPSRSLRQEK